MTQELTLSGTPEEIQNQLDAVWMDSEQETEALAKQLIIGDGKCGKSHLAGMAAAAGFKVLYLDGDVGKPTIQSLPIEARRNIILLDVADTLLGGVKDSRFFDTFKEFTTSTTFRWNKTQGKLSSRKTDQPTDVILEIKPAKMDSSCILVLDSWTGLTESMTTAAAIAGNVDLETAKTSEMRPVYQMAGIKATQMLQCIRSLRCHVIVLAHPDEYAHTRKPEGRKVSDIKETDLVVEWTKQIPKSTSKPHSLQMAKYFTDVSWMTVSRDGKERRLDFRLNDGRISGGHFNEEKSTEEYSFANLVKKIGGRVPEGPVDTSHWLSVTSPQQVAEKNSTKVDQVLDGTKSQPVKSSGGMGLASLMSKKA